MDKTSEDDGTAAGLTPLMQLDVSFEAPLVLANTPLGLQRLLVARGGKFEGDALAGKVLPGGGDWVRHRADGAANLDIRFTLQTDDKHLIGLSARGIFNASADIAARLQAGETPDPTAYYFRTAMFFETGAARYQRLNSLIAIGVGTLIPNGMSTRVFEVL
ncbi:MAG: DUF3237 domain-containing protein [Pseudomonadota bacterium]